MKYQEFIDHLLAVYYFNRKANPTFALSPFWIIDMMKEGYGSSDVRDIMIILMPKDIYRITIKNPVLCRN